MTELESLLLLSGSGASLVGAVVLRRHWDRQDQLRHRVMLDLRFPRDLSADQSKEALVELLGSPARRRALAAPDTVVVELCANERGLSHRLGVPQRHLDSIRSRLHSTVPGLQLGEPKPHGLPQSWTWTVELRLTNLHRPLRTDNPAAVSRSILATLRPLRRREMVLVQLLLASASPSQPVAGQGAKLDLPALLLAFNRTAPYQPSDREDVRAARSKQAAPLAWAVIRVAVVAANRARARHLAANVVASLSSTARPGVRLVPRTLPPAWVAQTVSRRSAPLAAFPVLLNHDELVGLVGWPLESPVVPGLVLVTGRRLAPSVSIASTGRVVARANYPGQERPLAQSRDSVLHHSWVVGPTGSGKSHLLSSLIRQDLERPDRPSVVVVDFKADLVDSVLDRLPPGRESDVVLLDPAAERSTGLNPLAHHAEDSAVVADQVFGTLRRLWRLESAPRTSDLLHGALISLAQVPGMSLVDLLPLLTSPAFRRRVTARFATDPVLGPFWAAFEQFSEGERAQVVAPTITRLRGILLRPSLRTMLGQSQPAIDVGQAIDSGKVLLVPLAAGKVGSEAAALIGALVMAELWVATRARANQSPEQRRSTSVFVDEWQQVAAYLPTDMADVLAQARGYGVGFTLANQSPAQLPAALREAVASNARSKVAFAASAKDSADLAREFGPDVAAADVQGLGRFEVMVSLADGAVASPPATGVTLPLLSPTGRAELIRQQALGRFARERGDVEADIRRRLGEDGPTSGLTGRRRRDS